MGRLFLPLVAVFFAACCLGLTPLAEADDGDGRPTELYGIFKQAPDGGIVFTNPQEPDVVYMPFDPHGVMDSLDILVAVRGTVRQSFVRDGKTYRILAVDSIKPMTDEYGSTVVKTQAPAGLPGCDPAEVREYVDKICYVYASYAVLTRPAAYAGGQDLRVVARTEADLPAAVCESRQGRPLFAIPDGGDFSYAGLSGDMLLVQNGQPDQVHGLMVVDLRGPKQVLDATILPGAKVAGGILHYEARQQQGCPAGKTGARAMTLDLRTGKAGAAGRTVCRP